MLAASHPFAAADCSISVSSTRCFFAASPSLATQQSLAVIACRLFACRYVIQGRSGSHPSSCVENSAPFGGTPLLRGKSGTLWLAAARRHPLLSYKRGTRKPPCEFFLAAAYRYVIKLPGSTPGGTPGSPLVICSTSRYVINSAAGLLVVSLLTELL